MSFIRFSPNTPRNLQKHNLWQLSFGSSVPDVRLTSFYFYIMYIGLQKGVFTLSWTTSTLRWNENEWTHRLFLVKFSGFTFFCVNLSWLLKWTEVRVERSKSWQILTLWWPTVGGGGGGGVSSPTPNWFFFSVVRAVIFIIITNKFFICRHIRASVNEKIFRLDLPCLL